MAQTVNLDSVPNSVMVQVLSDLPPMMGQRLGEVTGPLFPIELECASRSDCGLSSWLIQRRQLDERSTRKKRAVKIVTWRLYLQ